MNNKQMEKDLISVIVPVYNSEKYLRRCIDSILNQTYKNYEIILVDDGSTDNSGKICDEYANCSDCIRVVHQDNKGQAVARNIAIEQSRGEWLHFVDSDDVVHTQILEILLYAAKTENVNISVCDSVAQNRLPDDFFEKRDKKIKSMQINESTLKELFYLEKNYYWIVCAKLVRREIVLNNLFSEGKIFEDNAVVCRWLYESKRIAICESVMYFYCTEGESTVRSEFSPKKLDYLWALERQMLFYNKLNYMEMKKIVSKEYFSYVLMVCEKLSDKKIVKKTRQHVVVWCINTGLIVDLDMRGKKFFFQVCFPKSFKYYRDLKRKVMSRRRGNGQ